MHDRISGGFQQRDLVFAEEPTGDETPDTMDPREPEVPHLSGEWRDENGLCSTGCPASRETGVWWDCAILWWRVTPGITACPVRALYEAIKRGPVG